VIVSDRKYRHSGYQDSGGFDKKKSRSDHPRPEPQKERLEGGPRGRTTGGFGPEAFKCNKCGGLQHGLGELTPESVCQCGADLHSCSNCKHFDTTTLWECRETIPVRIASKSTRNECALFAAKIVRDLAPGKGGRVVTPDDARSAFENLFKK
jgi:hypothetical protein